MATALRTGVFIVAAKRTAFGGMNGTLRNMTPTDLGVVATTAALEQAKLDPKLVDDVIVGNVSQTAKDTPYLARHIGIRSGIRLEAPAVTINRLCGSGFESIVTAAKGIAVGDSAISIAGGAENMSMAPYAVRDIRMGTKFPNDLNLEDTLWSALNDQYVKMPMAMTAEKLGAQFGITREQCDEYAVRSQHAWQAAKDAGLFDNEITPVTIKDKKKGDYAFTLDEHARGSKASMETMAKLPSIFKKDGLVTAANASGISDGAGAVILASEEAVKAHNLTPLARIVGYASVGVDPTIMGHGPVPAINKILQLTGKKLSDIDQVEINEAFAAQYLACEKDLGLDRSITNMNGGAVAVGHPTGASGSRIMSHLTYELHRRGKNLAIGSACCGGGQGIGIMIERC